MKNVAFKLGRSEPSYRVGSVAVVKDRDLIIHTDDGTLDAERAASCLVPPGVGDEVAVVLRATDAHSSSRSWLRPTRRPRR